MSTATFHDYDLRELAQSPLGVYELSGRLIPEMAAAFEFDLPHVPTEEALQKFIGAIGPAKTLQDNIQRVQSILGSDSSALDLAASWVDSSQLLLPVERSFSDPNVGLPEHKSLGTTLFNTGVARWTIRRAQTLLALRSQGYDLGQTLVFAGNRRMEITEHEEVANLMGILDVQDDPDEGKSRITEAMFGKHFVVPLLSHAGIRVDLVAVNSRDGDEIFTQGIRANSDILGGGITVIGNAPATIQVAGQLRENARKFSKGYNNNGTIPSLYMVGDSLPLARTLEQTKSPSTHQNPYTALGQIARSALYLHRAANSFN
jgi:hypothetical protein